jgi:hypothetical protein
MILAKPTQSHAAAGNLRWSSDPEKMVNHPRGGKRFAPAE